MTADPWVLWEMESAPHAKGVWRRWYWGHTSRYDWVIVGEGVCPHCGKCVTRSTVQGASRAVRRHMRLRHRAGTQTT